MEDLIMRRNTTEYWKRFIPVLLLLAGNLFAIPVAESDARLVASNFYRSLYPQKGDLEISPISLISQSKQTKYEFYAYQIKGGGFVILANDDAAIPVIGYSDSGSLVEFIDHPAIEDIFESYNLQLKEIKDNRLDNAATVNQWKDLRQKDVSEYQGKAAVAPLVATRWNQGSGWNGLCPTVSGGPGGRAYAGCVAVTMAQIMKFWNYPATGNGSNTYTPSGFPSQSVNFAAQTYNWSAMSNTAYGSEIQKILYHAGVAINMMYGANGSGAYTYWPGHKSAYDALINNFRYANTIQGKYRSSYSDANWIALLKTELDAGRPIAYAGSGSGGHSFVCDGYDATNKMHFNWGWGGYADGYFTVTALNPAGSNFTNSQEAMIGIKPADNVAPVANNDSYFVFAGNTLTTTTTDGVLKNDTDANGNALTAVKLSDPTGGTLSFSANGTFTFTAPSQAGSYSFTYQANDGTTNSNTATVTVEVSGIGNTMIAMSSAKTAYYKENIVATTSTNMGTWSGYSMYYKNLEGDSDLELLAYNPTNGLMYYKNDMKGASVKIGTWVGSSIYFADVDGDGTDELLMRLSNGTLYYKADMSAAWTNLGVWTGYTLYFSDVDGDGKKDLVAYHSTTGKLYYRTAIAGTSNYVGSWVGANFYFANVDGDEAEEIFIRISNGTLYYKSELNVSWSNLGAFGGYDIYFKDLDGNGTKDLIGYHPITGKLYTKTDMSGSLNYVGAWVGASIYCADVDGDGADEIFIRISNGTLYYKSELTASWSNLGAFGGYNITFKDLDGNSTKDLVGYHPTTGKLYTKTDMSGSLNYVGAWIGASLYFSDADGDSADEIMLRLSNGDFYYKKDITTSWLKIGNYSGYSFAFGKFSTGSKGDTLTGIDTEPLEKNLELKQNYPNPFNSTTVINFVTSEKLQVKLNVYNAKGEFVKNLYNNISSVGDNSVVFNAEEMSSGLYFYRIEADRKVETRKMMLTK